MHIAFRVDSSTIIGYGHVMRCLTLAHALIHEFNNTKQQTNKGPLQVSFICRDHSGNNNKVIIDNHFQLFVLPSFKQHSEISTFQTDSSNTNDWLGTSYQQDAQDCIVQLKALPKIDLLIIDHYAIDYRWQELLKPYYEKLLVIDDLANRKHNCDYLLDQTYNRNKESYFSLVPENCQLLLGQDYILLRKEFFLLKEHAKKRRKEFLNKREVSSINILITMGGTDAFNLSELALLAAEELVNSTPNINVNLVLSSQSIHLASLSRLCLERPWVTLTIDSNNMADLMLSADIAIGACGGTAWERCSLGLPCLTTINAENQKLIAKNLSKDGAITNLGWHREISKAAILSSLNDLLHGPNTYQDMVDACFNICDGEGASRVANKILINLTKVTKTKLEACSIQYNIARPEHCELMFRWQSNKNIRKYALNPKIPSWEEHKKWYTACLIDPNRTLYLLSDINSNSVGLLRLDKLSTAHEHTETFLISIVIAPEYQGKGYAIKALEKLKNLEKNAIYLATVDERNIPSQKTFTKAGFEKTSPCSYQLKIENFNICSAKG